MSSPPGDARPPAPPASKLRVLHVIPAVAPRYGGPSTAVLGMGRALAQQGVDVLAVATDADGPGRLAVPLGTTTDYQGVPTIFFPRRWSEAFKYSRPLARWLDAHVAEFDVVHVHAVFSHSSLAAARACLRHGVPYVVRPLGSLGPWGLTQKRLRKRVLWHLGVGQMLRGAAAIHYASAGEQRQAEAGLRLPRGVVVPLGIDIASVCSAVSANAFRRAWPALGADPYVLMLARLHPVKNVDLLLGAFLELAQQPAFRSWHLVLAGDGEAAYVSGLRRLVEQRPESHRVHFVGWLDDPLKTAALKGAGLFALPSRHENFALAVAEAMACGVPVLVSPHVNLAEEIEAAHAGWVAPLERGALASTLALAMSDAAERARRGAAGRALVQTRYTWRSVAFQLRDLYRSLATRTLWNRE